MHGKQDSSRSLTSSYPSRRTLLRYALTLPSISGLMGVTARISSGEATGARPCLIDYAMRQIPASTIRAAGYSGVINYVSQSRPGTSFGAKPITRSYATSLTTAGLMIVSTYQYGKVGGSAPADYTRGFSGGISDAYTAWRLHTNAGGGANAPIFFCVDDDISRGVWDRMVLPWLRGINSVLGVQRTGVYGGINTCRWAVADGVIGYSTTPGYRWAWQTRSWSHGQIFPAAVLYQRVVNGPRLSGVPIDISDIRAPDCGQWGLHL